MKLNLTDLLDLAGALLIVAALAVFVAPFSLAGALAVAGVGLLVVSALVDFPPQERMRGAKRVRDAKRMERVRARRAGASS